jgi:hypothetical protein
MLSCLSVQRAIPAHRLPALNPDFLYAALDATAYAAFVKESRKKRAGATKLHRKSGEALLPPHKCGGLPPSLS